MLRYVILLFFFVHSNNANTMPMPIPKFEAFRPSGIRVSLPNTPGITEFFLWGNINVPMEGQDLGEIMLSTYEPTGGVWLIEDMDVHLNAGDTIYYTFFVNINGVVHRYERQQYTVTEIIDRTTTAAPTTVTPKPTPPPTPKPTPPPTTKPTPPPTPKPTLPPPTTPTTTTEKPITEMCFDDEMYIVMGKDKTVVTQKDANGKDLGSITNRDCSKTLVIDFDEGTVRFESAH